MSELLEHVSLLRSNLNDFAARCATPLGACTVGTGILPQRLAHGRVYQPRLIVISALDRVMRREQPSPSGEGNSFGAAFLEDEPFGSDLVRLIMVHTDDVDNLSPKKGPPDPADKVTLILKLSHAITTVEPTTPTPRGAEFLYQKVVGHILANGHAT